MLILPVQTGVYLPVIAGVFISTGKGVNFTLQTGVYLPVIAGVLISLHTEKDYL